ncbi:hypothetical protein A2Y85_04625 [candidate division WOR-3 bacterium RBG_13_43_14]|uniref:Phosphoglucosamine mutase n=1 Tax=candidate division WOR-3 bacterium RBG_13_43_14 TaxID=1802590 RepID=A0A1F4U9W4_UNCW3|nr:MAG: hypothetical protein A2Y85_04625 [candidate division WOR-3 bacterium RBG_13_43_14]
MLFMVRKLEADCGIIITASHNPEQWNALKFATGRGQFINQKEFRRFSGFLARFQDDEKKYPKQIVVYDNAIDVHIALIRRKMNKPVLDLKVGVDAVNGAAARALPLLCESLGCEVVRVNCRFSPKFPRGPEPVPENLSKLAEIVQRRHLDIGLACDPDGDRLAVVDELGRPVIEEKTLVLAADFVLRSKKGSIVVNLSTTALMEHIAAKYHQPLYRTAVGEGNVVARMLKENAVIGGEGNGGVIYPAINFGRDALAAAALILMMLKRSGKPLSTLLNNYPAFYMIKKKLKMSAAVFIQKISKLERKIPGRINRQDGLRFINRNYWVHIRPSQTEPLVRIIGESSDQQEIIKVIRTIVKIIKE